MRAGSRGINLYRWLRIRIAKRKKTLHFKRTTLQPRNHNSSIRGMSQRPFREWVVSGSGGLFWKQVRSRAQPHFLGMQQKTCPQSLHTAPIHPSAQLLFKLNLPQPLCSRRRMWIQQWRGLNLHPLLAAPGNRNVPWHVASPPRGFGSLPGSLAHKNE